MINKNIDPNKSKKNRKYPKTVIDYCRILMNHTDAEQMARNFEACAELITLNKYAGAQT